jgi:pimeloyl-ACP methyl ester carboxylesterase
MKNTLTFLVCFVLCVACGKEENKPVPYGSNTGKQFTINGRKIYYEEYGKGTPLLLLSGGGISRSIRDFGQIIPELSKHYRVIAPDTPGQGRSEEVDSLSYALLTDGMSKLIDSLKLDSIQIIGFSDGAIVAILLAEKRADKVRRVVAVGANNGIKGFNVPEGFNFDSVSVPTPEQWGKHHEKDIEWYNTMPPKKDWKKMVNLLNRMWYESVYFPESVYGNINIPVMIVQGDRDDISLDHALELHRAIKNSELCILPNTTHDVFKERPELITKIAMDFFTATPKVVN